MNDTCAEAVAAALPARGIRVLQFTEAAGGGCGRHIIDLSRELLAAGADVQILHGSERVDATFQEGLSELRGRGVRAYAVSMGTYPFAGARGVLRVLRQFAQSCDIIHAHSTAAGFLARFGLRAGIPIVYTPHGPLTWDPSRGRLLRAAATVVERFVKHRSCATIAVSEAERGHLVRDLGYRSREVACIRNGIAFPENVSRKRVRADLGIPESAVVTGFVGRFTPVKDPALLLRAFARVVRNGVPLSMLVLVGEGPLEPELRREASRLGIAGRVLFPGALNGRSVMAAFDLLALSSRSESLPYVLLEAMAYGLPAVSTNVGGVSELLEHCRNGLLVRPGSVDEMERALHCLIGNPSVRQRMSASALERVAQFTPLRVAQETLSIYGSAMRACGRPVREAL